MLHENEEEKVEGEAGDQSVSDGYYSCSQAQIMYPNERPDGQP